MEDGMRMALDKLGEWVIVSNLPPPMHGVSVFNELWIKELSRLHIPYRFLRIGTRGKLQNIQRFSIIKIAFDFYSTWKLLFYSIFKVVRHRRRLGTLYFTPSQTGWSVFRDVIISEIGKRFYLNTVGQLHGCEWVRNVKRKGLMSKLMTLALRNCNHVICLGKEYAIQLRDEFQLQATGILNGVEDPAPTPKQAPKPNDKLNLLFLSNLMRSKGLWIAAQSALHLKGKGVDVNLICAGNWVYKDEERAFLEEFMPLIKSGVITLMEFTSGEKKRLLFENAHFFLLPIQNPYEGQPLAIIEALSYGLPTFSTQHGGVPDLYEFPGGQLLCSTNHSTPIELANSIERLTNDQALYINTSRECRSHFLEQLTFNQCASKILRAVEA